MQIPALVQRNTNFWLACHYELDQEVGEQLYSIKWYKKNEEFYRLLAGSPDASPTSGSSGQQQQQYFGQAGVNVMVSGEWLVR